MICNYTIFLKTKGKYGFLRQFDALKVEKY